MAQPEGRRGSTGLAQSRLVLELSRGRSTSWGNASERDSSIETSRVSRSSHADGSVRKPRKPPGWWIGEGSTTLSVRTPPWVHEIKDGARSSRFATRVFLFLYDPSSSFSAYLFMLLMCVLSVVAVVNFALQESRLHEDHEGREARSTAIYAINAFVAFVFLGETIARVATHPNYARLVRDPFAWIDFLALAPLLTRVGLGPSANALEESVGTDVGRLWFGLLEAITALRLLRFARYFHGGLLLGQVRVRGRRRRIEPDP